jgi:sigma-E factor negative regulatory protein RseB
MQAQRRSRAEARRIYHGFLIAAALVLAAPVARAADQPSASSQPVLQWLHKIQAAARELDYAGVYTYQQGDLMLSSRIVHMVDGTGERERLEMLDGPRREFVRHNEVTQCLIPDKKLVLVERRRGDRFPALLLGSGEAIPQHYDLRSDDTQHRIAGRDCVITELVPKDGHRYGYRLCTDSRTHLLLKAQTISAQHGVVDQMTFTSLQIGTKVEPAELSPSWETKDWTFLETKTTPVDLARDGWRIPLPPGFQVVKQVSRPMKQGKKVSQLVMSDGLAAISVFIEPYDPALEDSVVLGPASTGAMNIFRTRIGEHWLTSLGEAPPMALQEIAERTEFVPLAQH